ALGLVGFIRAVPILLFSMVAGVAADVFDRRKLMLVTQLAGAGVAAMLATLAFAGVERVWPVYALAAVASAAAAFDPPARHSMVPMLVPRDELPNAISLNSAMMQTASVLGPATGAVLLLLAMLTVAPRMARQGPVLIWAVAGYGVSTVVFGVSSWFWVTFACLAAAGACDAVSMIIRNLVRQLETPDAIRGRM